MMMGMYYNNNNKAIGEEGQIIAITIEIPIETATQIN